MKTLHATLKASRAKSELSLRQLAARCGISSALISRIENGRKALPYFHQVARMALVLGVDLNKLARTEMLLGSEKRRRASSRQMRKNLRDPEVSARIHNGQRRAMKRWMKTSTPEQRKVLAAKAWRTKRESLDA